MSSVGISIDDDIPQVSRKSPGIFGYFHLFQTWPFLLLFMVGFPVGFGAAITFLNWIPTKIINITIFIREMLTFATITWCGTFGCLIFQKRVPLFNFRLAYLINAYGAIMFAASYFLGYCLDVFFGLSTFVEIFFILGALISYIVLFVVYFSFTPVGNPWHIFLALIQPTVGILIYSFFSQFLNISFLIRAAFFFIASALIFAVLYGPIMAFVSLTYRKATGVGGYNFIRAFVQSLLVDNQDDLIERYFTQFSKEGNLKLEYLAFQEKDTSSIKGLFLIPNVHFGPFKTAGSAALGEKIYQTFSAEIPGLTVYHTTVTHGQNFAQNQFNSHVISQIREDIRNLHFETPQTTRFIRTAAGNTKVLGCIINQNPFLMFTRHPDPTDDIVPEVGEKIKKIGTDMGYKETMVVDCHNSLIGDEILITEDSPEAKEMEAVTRKFFQQIIESQKTQVKQDPTYKLYSTIKYGVARDPMTDLPIANGIGGGGILVHLFEIDGQRTALIHVDGNNATIPVRSALVNLGENKGVDRTELSTSDTHAVVRILSSQGYYPIGTKIGISTIVPRVGKLIDQAIANLKEVNVATYQSNSPGYLFWKDLSFFDVIVGTIERCLTVSKLLLTIGLVFPTILTLLFFLFYYQADFPLE